MKGLLMKDFLTIRKKYGIPRVAMDIFIIVALMVVLKGTGAIYISFLLIPIEVMSMVMSLATCDQQCYCKRSCCYKQVKSIIIFRKAKIRNSIYHKGNNKAIVEPATIEEIMLFHVKGELQ